ncbi:MAG: class I SAM-dependent methyltransferase [Gemmatimonadota bacterium]
MTTLLVHDVDTERRFAFGLNWARFLSDLDESRIRQAERSLCEMLDTSDLTGRTFLDIGSGSGLFSLAARRLGATVRSIDFDPQSVACTRELRRRYFPEDTDWRIDQGSVLDAKFVAALGQWDIVYSWGVLHHTGSMWVALGNAAACVKDDGRLFIAIYNDQGRASAVWLKVKQAYNRLPRGWRWLVLVPASIRLWGPGAIRDLLTGKPFHTWRNYARRSLRGMSPWRDTVDWVGGLPFEVAKPEQIVSFYRQRGYELHRMITCAGRHGCNEFVFRKAGDTT